MLSGSTTVLVVAVLFLASFIRSAFGFGEALIAVPLLALVLPVEVVAPVAVLASITVALVAVVQDSSHIEVRSAGWLVLSTLPGIPLGLLLLKTISEPIVKCTLAVVIGVFSSYMLLRSRPREFPHDRFAWIFGFAAGVLGGAYGMNGPPLVIYGSLRRWSPEKFRATLQAYFLPASLLGMLGYFLAGFWTQTVTRLYLLSLPLGLAAIFSGRALNRRMNLRQFHLYVHSGLLVIAIILLIQALRTRLFTIHSGASFHLQWPIK